MMNVKPMIPFYEDPVQLKTKVHDALKYYEINNSIDLVLLEQWINESNTPINFIMRVFQEASLESELEAEKLLDILTRLWNVTPRQELDGLSPLEKLDSRGHNDKK